MDKGPKIMNKATREGLAKTGCGEPVPNAARSLGTVCALLLGLAILLCATLAQAQSTGTGPKPVPKPGARRPRVTFPPAREYLARAQRLANLFYFDEAKAVLLEALRRYPNDWKLNRLYIDLHETFHLTHTLIPYYKNRITREPGNAVGYAGAALVNLYSGYLAVAEEFVKRAQKLDPQGLATLSITASLARWRALDHPEQVIEAYEKLMSRYPDFSPAYSPYLQWLAYHKDESRMRRVLERANQRRDLNPYYMVYEVALLQRDVWYDSKAAITIYGRILGLDPSLVYVKKLLAGIYGSRGDAERQRTLLEEITREAPDWYDGWISLASFYAAHQQYDQAEECYTRAGLTPNDNGQKRFLNIRRAECMIDAGKFDEAAELLGDIIQKQRGTYPEREARSYLTMLLSRKPEDRIFHLKNMPYLEQKGAYCGPASLAMVFGYWGERKTQDEIASVIYTGIAGTAAQTIQTYCRMQGFEAVSFRGSVKEWKRLLDQGVPILWLQYRGLSDAHYRVVAGYNDLRKEFILHDPQTAVESTIEYDKIDDTWVLPNLKQSLAIYPARQAATLSLGRLDAPVAFQAINMVIYLATGSNLFQRFFPGILFNFLIPGLFIALCLPLMRWLSFPRDRRALARYLLLHGGVILALGLLVHLCRFPQAVSLFVSYYAGMAAFTGVLAVSVLACLLLRKKLAMHQMTRLNLAIFLAFAAIGWVNHRSDLIINIPLLILFCGMLVAIHELPLVILLGRLKHRPNYSGVLGLLRRYGSEGKRNRGILEACWREMILEKRRRNYSKAADLAYDLLEDRGIGNYFAERVRQVLVECLLGQSEEMRSANAGYGLKEALALIEEMKAAPRHRLNALYLDILHAKAQALSGNLERASALAATVQTRLEKTDWVRLGQRLLEALRGHGTEYRHFYIIHAINRLTLARAKGDTETIDAIAEEFRDTIDQEFMLKLEFLSLKDERGPGVAEVMRDGTEG